jgi:hypothetical protein
MVNFGMIGKFELPDLLSQAPSFVLFFVGA